MTLKVFNVSMFLQERKSEGTEFLSCQGDVDINGEVRPVEFTVGNPAQLEPIMRKDDEGNVEATACPANDTGSRAAIKRVANSVVVLEGAVLGEVVDLKDGRAVTRVKYGHVSCEAGVPQKKLSLTLVAARKPAAQQQATGATY